MLISWLLLFQSYLEIDDGTPDAAAQVEQDVLVFLLDLYDSDWLDPWNYSLLD